MMVSMRTIAAILCLCGTGILPVMAAEREAVFFSFSAKDRHDIFVRNLKRGEVTVLVDGEPAEVRFFAYQDVRTAVALVLENSPRTAKYRKSHPQFGRVNLLDRIRFRLLDDFLEPLVGTSKVLVADFYKDLEIREHFTDDLYALRAALDAMEPNVAFVDKERIPVGRMLARSVRLLAERPERRKVLVFFTTTIDTESVADLEEYQEMLRYSDVDVFVVSFAHRNVGGAGYSHAERVNRFYFRKLTEETSGELFLAGEYVFLDELMNQLRGRLEHVYTVGFYARPERHPTARQLEVQLARERCDVRHRRTIYY